MLIRRAGQKPVYATFQTEDKAREFAGDHDCSPSLGDLIDRYILEKSPPRNEAQRMRFLKAVLGRNAATAISKDMIAHYRDARLFQGLKAGTVKKEMCSLSKLLEMAANTWGLKGVTNVAKLVKKPSEKQARVTTFSPPLGKTGAGTGT